MSERLSWSAFWPFYLAEHNDRRNRRVHVVGTTLALGLLVAAVVLQFWWFVLAGLVIGYAFAWIGHAVFQKNRPATFRYPLKSFASDWRLWAVTMVGKADAAFDAHGIEQR